MDLRLWLEDTGAREADSSGTVSGLVAAGGAAAAPAAVYRHHQAMLAHLAHARLTR